MHSLYNRALNPKIPIKTVTIQVFNIPSAVNRDYSKLISEK